ncbi:MAG TPA: hypothetical protein VKY31_09870 [Terriglobia bacterium]|nr:hypothetical protein [Terriglobia bacterium]
MAVARWTAPVAALNAQQNAVQSAVTMASFFVRSMRGLGYGPLASADV